MIVGPFMVHVLVISSVAFLKIITFISKFSFCVSSAHTCNSFKAHIGTKPCILLYAVLAPVVQKLDSAIHMINHYPVYKCCGNHLRYPVDCDLSGG